MRYDPVSNSGRREVGGRSVGAFGAPMAASGGCGERDGERLRSRGHSRTGVARVGGEIGAVGDGSSG